MIAFTTGDDMTSEAELRDLIDRLYAGIGGDPTKLLRVSPRYGAWYTALKFEIIRADNARTSVWRKDVDDGNHGAIIAALKAFSR
jgi:hypothetical protein